MKTVGYRPEIRVTYSIEEILPKSSKTEPPRIIKEHMPFRKPLKMNQRIHDASKKGVQMTETIEVDRSTNTPVVELLSSRIIENIQWNSGNIIR